MGSLLFSFFLWLLDNISKQQPAMKKILETLKQENINKIQLYNIKVTKIMTQKKSQHILAIQQVLAQFDIETQVKRITLQTMDAFMLGNKQAFEYIKQWENKFIDFQARLVKAESYYRNIELNVNSKIEVTNSLNSRLQKFAQQFWSAMKQSNQCYQQMRKNYLNLVKQTGSQASTQRALQRDLLSTNKKLQKLQQRLQEQTTRISEHFTQIQQEMVIKNNERKQESSNILIKLIESTSKYQSKTIILDQLCKDIDLYKNQKISISSQIQAVYEELRGKVDQVEFNKIRVYIDNSTTVNTERIQVVYQQLNSKIEQQQQHRQHQISNLTQTHQSTTLQTSAHLQQLQHQLTQTNKQTNKAITALSTTITERIVNHDNKFIQQMKRIQSIDILNQKFMMKLEELDAGLADKTNVIHQMESNINSINAGIRDMELENNKRGQELAQLRVDADDKGDIGDQVKKMAEKILAHDQTLRKHTQKIDQSQITQKQDITTTNQRIQQLDKRLTNQLNQTNNRQKQSKSELELGYNKRCNVIEQRISKNHEDVIIQFTNIIAQKIDSIKQKFVFLQNLNTDMEVFKKTFQEQLHMNEQLNAQVKDKMDRMFNMFTKLKTDAFMKIQLLTQDQLKSSNKIKDTTKILADFCSLLTHYNQIITVILSVGMWNQFLEERDGPEEYKVASLIQGWVLELTRDRVKYRGENATKRSLMQLCLEQHVKNGDKLKGGIIQNGKDVFGRMSGGSEDYQQTRRRSISRKKQRQSQLPKVHR